MPLLLALPVAEVFITGVAAGYSWAKALEL